MQGKESSGKRRRDERNQHHRGQGQIAATGAGGHGVWAAGIDNRRTCDVYPDRGQRRVRHALRGNSGHRVLVTGNGSAQTDQREQQ
jgi:hypothetical protein